MCNILLLGKQMGFFREIQKCFFHSVERSYLEKREPISTLKLLHGTTYSFQQLTQLSQENSVLDAPAVTYMFFIGETHVLLLLRSTGLLKKENLSPT
jgi:hypothetical protein